MRAGRQLTFLGAAFFIIYGVVFVALPDSMSLFVTDASPGSSSAQIDVRATYGGMSIAVGILLVLLGRLKETTRLGVTGLLLLMVCMATGRTIGIVLDGDANALMYVYLGAELLVAGLCGAWLLKTKVREAV